MDDLLRHPRPFMDVQIQTVQKWTMGFIPYADRLAITLPGTRPLEVLE